MAVVLILGVILLSIVGAGVLKAKARMHSANEARAVRDMIERRGPDLPSWHADEAKRRLFAAAVAGSASTFGIPRRFAERVMEDARSSPPVYALAAKLERHGSSFAEQQAGAARFLRTTWNELSADEKARVAAAISS